ncbi:InlB B-repeat-containing protein [Olsenella intestinalis]|uniref:InlB B-repeat-containing protein n=1 Tax=Olsenella intestinalis TaxID=2930083 RepID=UPI00200D33ED|nr:InlB B-repeat-containing protein [Olsenella intestinalis]
MDTKGLAVSTLRGVAALALAACVFAQPAYAAGGSAGRLRAATVERLSVQSGEATSPLVYPVTGERASRRIELTFMSSSGEGAVVVERRIVHAGEALDVPSPVPESRNSTLDAWVAKDDASVNLKELGCLDGALTEGQIAALTAGLTPEVTQVADGSGTMQDVSLYRREIVPTWHTCQRVYLRQGTKGNVDLRDNVAAELVTDAEGNVDLSVVDPKPFEAVGNVKLVAWETEDGRTFGASTTATGITVDTTLYPILAQGTWITLDAGEGVSGVPRVFGSLPEGATGPIFDVDMEDLISSGEYLVNGWNPGYDFAGWYTEAGGAGTQVVTATVNDDGSVTCAAAEGQGDTYRLEGEQTLHAKWVARTDTPYTIVHMVEGPEGGPGEGVYTRYASICNSSTVGKTGDPIPDSAWNTYKISKYHRLGANDSSLGFAEKHTTAPDASNSTQVTIAADGSAVKYIYWNRDRVRPRLTNKDRLPSGASKNTYLLDYTKASSSYNKYVKWGMSSSLWDPQKIAFNLTTREDQCAINKNRYYFEFYNIGTWIAFNFNSSGENTFPQSPFADGTDGTTQYVGSAGKIKMTKLVDYIYYYESADGTGPRTATLSGVTKTFGEPVTHRLFMDRGNGEVNLESIWNIGLIDDIGDSPRFKRWAYATKGTTLQKITAAEGVPQAIYNIKDVTGDGVYDLEVFMTRRSYKLSFAECDGVVGKAVPTGASGVMYEAPLATYDPHFEVGVTRRYHAGALYEFKGWFSDLTAAKDPDGAESAAFAVDIANAGMPEHDLTLYAGWKPVDHTVTFDANGGHFGDDPAATTATVTVASGNHVSEPEAELKDEKSRVFAGWYTDSALTHPWSIEIDNVAQDGLTLHARWLDISAYTVTYHDYEGAEVEELNVGTKYVEDSKVPLSPVPADMRERTEGGATQGFLGWSRESDPAKRAGSFLTTTVDIKGDVDLYPAYGDAVDEAGPSVSLSTNYEDNAKQFKPTLTDVTFTLPAVAHPGDVTVLPTPSPDSAEYPIEEVGYTFAGWNTAADGSGTLFSGGEVVAAASETTLHAMWQAKDDSVSYEANVPAGRTATGSTAPTTGRTFDSVAAASCGFACEGFHFTGWNAAADGGGSSYAAGAPYRLTPDDNVLHAQWAGNSYTVKFNANASGATGTMAPQELTYGAAAVPLRENAFARKGYTFDEWATAEDGSGTRWGDKADVSDLTPVDGGTYQLYAQWEANDYEVTLSAPDATTAGADKVTATFDAAMPAATMPARTGYDFAGYWDSATGGTCYYAADGSSAKAWDKDGATTLHARWTPKSYEVTLSAPNATTAGTDKVTATFDAAMPAATMPARNGYDFAGYFDATEGGTCYYAADGSSAKAWDKDGATTLHAQWTPRTYEVTLLSPDATTAGTAKVTATYDAGMPEATMPERIGYGFVGYFDAAEGGTCYYGADGASAHVWDKDGDATLYARWKAGEYTVTLTAPDASTGGTASVTATYDSDMPLEGVTMPKRTGYHFLGFWDEDEATCYYAGDGASAHTWDKPGNATLHARWQPKSCDITVSANGGTNAPAGVVATYDQGMPALSGLPTRAGHTLTGITDAEVGGTLYYRADGTPARAWDQDVDSAILYAQWEVRSYPVDFASELAGVEGIEDALLAYTDPDVTTASVAYGGRAPEIVTAPVDVFQSSGASTIHHRLIGWTWSYVGADGMEHAGTQAAGATSGSDSSYASVELWGLEDAALAEGTTITLTADYTIMPYVSATAENGKVGVAQGSGATPGASGTSASVDTTEASSIADVTVRFEPNSRNWKLADGGITVRDQYGNTGQVDVGATTEQTVSLCPAGSTTPAYTVSVLLAYDAGSIDAGYLTITKNTASTEASVPLSVSFAYVFDRVQATYDHQVMLEQADGTYVQSGPTVTHEAVDAGSEAAVEPPAAPAGYSFAYVSYLDGETGETSEALPVSWDDSTVLRYYYSLNHYRATLRSADACSLVGAEGWDVTEPSAAWTRTFTVLDSFDLPVARADDYRRGFLGWRPTGGATWQEGVEAGTAADLAFAAEYRDLRVVPRPATSGALTYTGAEQAAPVIVPEGFTLVGYDLVDGDGVVVGSGAGELAGTDAGTYDATFTVSDGSVWEGGGSDVLALAWTIEPADAREADVAVGDCVFDGTPQRPVPAVTLEGVKLVAGRDFDVTYESNVEVGTARAIVTFKGNYAGTASATFEILKPRDTGQVMYRLYNPYSGEHFYTASPLERDAVAAAGWSYEGVGWVAPVEEGEPVYRLYNPYGGDHHYTLSAGERDVLVTAGWNYEGVGWLSCPEDDQGAQPVWRQYNPYARTGSHNFTTSMGEHVALCEMGWRGEGVAWYGLAQ